MEADLLESMAPAKTGRDQWSASMSWVKDGSATETIVKPPPPQATSADLPPPSQGPPPPGEPRVSDKGRQQFESIFFRGKGDNDVLDLSVLQDAWRLMDDINAITVSSGETSDGGEDEESTGPLWGFDDLCVRIDKECFKLSVLDYWKSADEMARDVMPRTTLRRHHPFRPRELILGGFELNDWEVVKAEAAMITLFIHNVDKEVVKRWEAQVRAACLRAHSRENSTIDVHVLTSYSLKESIAESISTGVVLTMVAFAILACLLVCTMGCGSFSIVVYCVLTLFGLALIAASVLGSFALMQYFGQKISPFKVQAIPMLLLGIGVDYLVMMCYSVEKAEMCFRKGTRVEGTAWDTANGSRPSDNDTEFIARPVKTCITNDDLEVVDTALKDGGMAIAASALVITGGCLAASVTAGDLLFVQNVLLQLCLGILVLACLISVSFPASMLLLRRFCPVKTRAWSKYHSIIESGDSSRQHEEKRLRGRPPRHATKFVTSCVKWTIRRALFGWVKYGISAGAALSVLLTFFMAPTLTADMTVTDLLGRRSQFADFMREASQFFNIPVPVEFRQVGGNFSLRATRAEFKQTMSSLAELDSLHPLQLQHHWLNDMISWIAFFSPHKSKYRKSGYVIPDDVFPFWLEEFTQHPVFESHNDDLILRRVSGSTSEGPLGLEVIGCRVQGFSMGSNARVSSAIAVLHEIQDVLQKSWLDIEFKMSEVQELSYVFTKLPSLVGPITVAAGCGTVLVVIAFLATQRHGWRCHYLLTSDDACKSGGRSDTSFLNGDCRTLPREGSWSMTSSVDILFAISLAIASAGCTLRWIMGVARFELHPFSFIYTVGVVVLTGEFTTHVLVSVVDQGHRPDCVLDYVEMHEVASSNATTASMSDIVESVSAERSCTSVPPVETSSTPHIASLDQPSLPTIDATFNALQAVGPRVRFSFKHVLRTLLIYIRILKPFLYGLARYALSPTVESELKYSQPTYGSQDTICSLRLIAVKK